MEKTNTTAATTTAIENIAFDALLAAMDAATIVYPTIMVPVIRDLRRAGVAEAVAIDVVGTAYKALTRTVSPAAWLAA